MNATKRSAARAGLVVCSVLAFALTGCRTHVVHSRTRTVYVPTPPQVVHVPPAPAPQAPPPVVYVPAPAPQPPPPVVVVAPPEQPPVVVIQSENDFYEPLTAYGRWVVVGSYGRCWIPGRVEAGWRPYANGYWQRTDAGWYWVSEEPWGWATYHYGRWDFHAQFGWIWVPHTQWAPAWVAWREGSGYVGWAPLRPSVTFNVNIGVADHEPAFASRAYVFVEHRRMLEPVRPKMVIVNNTTIINKTVNITNVKVVNKTVINEGPRPDVIERASGRKVQAVPVREFRHREEATVASRERNIPTARDRNVEPPTRSAPQAVEQKSAPTPVNRPIERPAQIVTQPPRPQAAPTLPTPVRPELERPARAERKSENEIGRNVTTTPPTVGPNPRSVANPPQAVPSGRDLRSVEKPAVAAKPMLQPVPTKPIPGERKRETAIEERNVATPPSVEPNPRSVANPPQAVPPGRNLRPVEKPAVNAKPTPQPVPARPIPGERKRETAIEERNTATPPSVVTKPRNEARPEPHPTARPESKSPVKVEPRPATAVEAQVAPPANNRPEKRLTTPRENPRAAEQAEGSKKANEDKKPKKDEEQATKRPVPTRPTR